MKNAAFYSGKHHQGKYDFRRPLAVFRVGFPDHRQLPRIQDTLF
jgi:hypothetical protein